MTVEMQDYEDDEHGEDNPVCIRCLNDASDGCDFCAWWDTVTIEWFDRIEDLIKRFWQPTGENLEDATFNDGMTWSELIAAHAAEGKWAFTGGTTVLAWWGAASEEAMVEMLGHELGHVMEEAPAVVVSLAEGHMEEAKAQRWGLVALRAMQWMRERAAAGGGPVAS